MRVKSSQTAARTIFREKTTARADKPVANAMTKKRIAGRLM
jgi:hypothetical protein